jgi:hypothetical protein
MGIRSRLKKLLGKQRIEDVKPPPKPAPPRAPAPPKPAPKPPLVAAPPMPKEAPKPSAPGLTSADDKVAKHFEKARRGVLKFVLDQGGVATLHSMHSHSERRYFIAHKRFSELMETLVDAGLVLYDVGEGEATLTDAGSAYIA